MFCDKCKTLLRDGICPLCNPNDLEVRQIEERVAHKLGITPEAVDRAFTKTVTDGIEHLNDNLLIEMKAGD